MVRLFLLTLAILAVLVVGHSGRRRPCDTRKQRFELRCLARGYTSKSGCGSGRGELTGRQWQKCKRFEIKLNRSCQTKDIFEWVFYFEDCALCRANKECMAFSNCMICLESVALFESS